MSSLCAVFLLSSCAAAETITYTVPVGNASAPATLHMVKESPSNSNVNRKAAVQKCKDLGGELAQASLAPERMIKFTCKTENLNTKVIIHWNCA